MEDIFCRETLVRRNELQRPPTGCQHLLRLARLGTLAFPCDAEKVIVLCTVFTAVVEDAYLIGARLLHIIGKGKTLCLDNFAI